MGNFVGYDEEAIKNQKKQASKKSNVVTWHNVEGDIVKIDYNKGKKFVFFISRLEKVMPVFGLSLYDTDFKLEKNGQTVVYNEFTDTATAYQNYRERVSYFRMKRDFVLQDERLVKNCDTWLQTLKCRKANFWLWVLLLGCLVGCIAFAITGITQSIIPLAIFGFVLLVPSFFLCLAIFKINKKVRARKKAIKESKEIWKELKAKQQ